LVKYSFSSLCRKEVDLLVFIAVIFFCVDVPPKYHIITLHSVYCAPKVWYITCKCTFVYTALCIIHISSHIRLCNAPATEDSLSFHRVDRKTIIAEPRSLIVPLKPHAAAVRRSFSCIYTYIYV